MRDCCIRYAVVAKCLDLAEQAAPELVELHGRDCHERPEVLRRIVLGHFFERQHRKSVVRVGLDELRISGEGNYLMRRVVAEVLERQRSRLAIPSNYDALALAFRERVPLAPPRFQ